MANSLHFLPDAQKLTFLTRLRGQTRHGAQFILVEYNVDQGNSWVPYPLSYASWQKLARLCGYTNTSRLASRPSRFLNEIYASISLVGDAG